MASWGSVLSGAARHLALHGEKFRLAERYLARRNGLHSMCRQFVLWLAWAIRRTILQYLIKL
jgi:hypothetical protein